LHLKKETRAVSTLLLILIVFASLIIGGLISYFWVMSSYYNMPANPSFLSVENAVFPIDNFTYFNVTVLNPSSSVLSLNITGFRVVVESQNETFIVGTAEPTLPFPLGIGTKQDFKCLQNWSNFAGENVTVEPLSAPNASIMPLTCATPTVKLTMYGFSTDEDVQHFNVTVENWSQSVINLTITDIRVFDVPVTSTPSLPTVIPIGEQQLFRCAYDWADMSGQNLTIKVLTDVGFEQVYVASPIQGAFLSIDNVSFDDTDATYFNITVKSLPTSATSATLSGVNLTLADNTTLALVTIPYLRTLLVSVAPNDSQSVMCLWDWSAHRNERIVVQAFTKQGFTVQNNTVTTPPAVVWSAENAQFDLADLQHFSVNVTNAPVSLEEINVTEADFNGTPTSILPTVVSPANSSIVVCGFNWTGFVGTNVNVTVHAFYSGNDTTINQSLALPYLKVANASFSNFSPGNPYVNITVFDSQYSPFNATITRIFVTVNNTISPIDGTLTAPKIGSNGYLLSIGTEVTFVCPWDWTLYPTGLDATVTVQTAEGPAFSATFKVEKSP
jgi:uncharacterized protein YjbI with pentapeptide repeats